MAILNLRSTEGYVTDDVGQTWGNGNYPTTRDGVTFGVTAGSPEYRNRETGVDPRIAGILFERPNETLDYRVDVPTPGVYNVGVIMSDLFPTYSNIDVLDSSGSVVATVASVDLTGICVDVNGNSVTRPNVVDSTIAVSLTTHVTIRLKTTGGVLPAISSVRVEPGTGTTQSIVPQLLLRRRRMSGGGLVI